MITFPSVKKTLLTVLLATMALTCASQALPFMPHLTDSTYFFHKKVGHVQNMSDPSEGIFYVMEYNRAIGYASYYGFYTVDGRTLFAPEWETAPSAGHPRFDSGAAVVKAGRNNAAGKQLLCILYADGSVKELPVSWTDITQFHDGVAKVGYRDGRNQGTFYINTRGEKIWPHLDFTYNISTKGSMAVKNGARYLRQGRRAYFDNAKRKWGYLDEKGQPAIPAQFVEVRDFANGYALVIASVEGNDRPVFIDRNGKQVVMPEVSAPTLQYAIMISDVDAGMYCVAESSRTTYFDMQGKEIRTEAAATPFFRGFTFARPSGGYDGPTYALDSLFGITRRIQPSDLPLTQPDKVKPSPIGVVTIDGSNVYRADGLHLLTRPRRGDMIGRFSAEGHARATATLSHNNKDHEYLGIIGAGGNFLVVFGENPEDGGPWYGGSPEPRYPPVDTLTIGKLLPGDTIPEGPKNYETATYEVCLKAYPEGAANLTGAGKYKYGDKVRIGGKAADGYILSDVINENPVALYGEGLEYEVRGDGCITVCFIEEETQEPGNGAWQGTLNASIFPAMGSMELPVYLQMSPDNSYTSPYGDRTAGVFTMITDPAVTYETKIRRQGRVIDGSKVTFNYFSAPMRVMGISQDDGHKWLVVEGGNNIMANTAILSMGPSNSSMGGLEVLMANLMMIFDGMADVSLTPARYRIEMLDEDPSTGAFTFGTLQRFSPRYGWVPGGDPRIYDITRGLFVTKVDPGYSANTFLGVRMTPVKPLTDILWYPPASFFDNDENTLEGMVRRMGENYRSFTSDYERLRKLNIRDLSSAPANPFR